MRIGITGAAGGIGSVLSDRFAELGISTVLVDNLENGSLENFEHKINKINLNLIDILDFENLRKILRNCDLIIHLAAVSSLVSCQTNPTKAFNVNLSGTSNVVKIANEIGAPIIFASTSAVYENSKLPFVETEIVNPHLIYSLSKKFAEDLILGNEKTNNLQFVILRLFNVFGPKQDIRRKNPPLINYLIREVTLDKIPTIYAPLNQERDYVFIEDVIDLILKFALNEIPFSNNILNVCSGTSISISQIIKAVETGLKKQLVIENSSPEKLWEYHENLFVGKKSLDPSIVRSETLKVSIGDPELTARLLNWKCKHDVLHEIEIHSAAISDYVRKTLLERNDFSNTSNEKDQW